MFYCDFLRFLVLFVELGGILGLLFFIGDFIRFWLPGGDNKQKDPPD